MRLSRTGLIQALEIALGPADLEHLRSPDVALIPATRELLLSGRTAEGAGWDAVPCEGELERSFVVPGRPLLQMLREIRTEEVRLELRRQELHLEAGSYRAVMWTRPDEGPSGCDPARVSLSLPWNLVGELGERVAYARPKGRNKSIFPGIHFLLGPKGIQIVATDGRRLALAESKHLAGQGEVHLVLPGRFLLLASRYLQTRKSTVLALGEARVQLCQGSTGVAGTTLPGPMPSYRALLPGRTRHRGRLRRSRAIEAMRQARLFSSRVELELDECKFLLSTPATQEGMAVIRMGMDWTAPRFQVQLNADEFLEALENLPGDEVVMEVQAENHPLVLRSSEDSAVATLMPLLW